jgi:hypothetical protein
LHSITHKVKGSSPTGNEILDENRSLRRVQSYSPNLRVPNGNNGVQKIGEELMDIRSLVRPTDNANHSYVGMDTAASKATKWLGLAKKHISLLRESCGMARLELTFETNVLDDNVLDKGIETLMKTFVKSTKAYSGNLVTNLAEISLLSYEGIFNALMVWFQPNSVCVPPCWDTFGDVWQYLTYISTTFFSGKRSYQSKASYTPRLGYMFSRPFLNPSWVGINTAISKNCVNEENLKNLTSIWNKTRGITSTDSIVQMKKKILRLDGKFDTKFCALLRLLESNCNSVGTSINSAVACSACKTITSTIRSKSDEWLSHPCSSSSSSSNNNNNSNSLGVQRAIKNINLQSLEFTDYLMNLVTNLSGSQSVAFEAIVSDKENCFLTGVAGSGKSHILKCVLPTLIRYYGYSRIFVTAVTNVAAVNVNGLTLSKFMGLVVNEKHNSMVKCRGEKLDGLIKEHIEDLSNNKKSLLQDVTLCAVLIVDEAGMCDKNLFNFLDCFLRQVKKRNKKPFGGVKIILIGDVLQLEPIVKEKDAQACFFFENEELFKTFKVCYLRENHRQTDDEEFLVALNKVRVGDATALDYMNNILYELNVASSVTLKMARNKTEHISQIKEDMRKISYRINIKTLIGVRNSNEMFNEKDFQKRLDNAVDSGFSDLVVCLEHNETNAYTKLRGENKILICINASDTPMRNPYTPEEIYKKLDTKLASKLDVFVGMPCRVTYRTNNPYICANTLVVITEIISNNKNALIDSIVVATTSTAVQTMTVTLSRVSISESVGNHTVCRTQFSLLSSVGLLPWGLQGLTITENIFYDNSRSSQRSDSIKGLLYTVMSRVKKKEQFSFLHKITEEEIKNGVSQKAKNFDDNYRLQDPRIVFECKKIL